MLDKVKYSAKSSRNLSKNGNNICNIDNIYAEIPVNLIFFYYLSK